MKLIKLSAIDSTNDFLKELSKNQALENFTTVVAEAQTKGKGQMGAVWMTEAGKNLIMSMLIKDVIANPNQVFDLNVAVAVSILQVLQEIKIPNLTIKWPNDILSHDKKIAGVLIENRFRSDDSIASVVGIGLNVNQTDFSHLPNASSLALVANKEFDVDFILEKMMEKLKINSEFIAGNTEKNWQFYHDHLFRKDFPTEFEDKNKTRFSGTIVGVTKAGNLEVMLENKSIQLFEIKEITMLY